MALVIRSKRDIKLSDNETSGISPGEYYRESQTIKEIERQSPEFQSKSKRYPELNKSNNNPGPGSYEKNYLFNEFSNKYIQNKRPSNIYETLKSTVIPTEIKEFIEKNQVIAFNTRGGRFNYKFEELEKDRNIPGPGAYYNLNINKRNNIKRFESNDSSMFVNNFSSQITNDKSNRSRLLKKVKSYNSSSRTETIPSKGNLGYDFDMYGEKKMIENKSNKNESLGPGEYNIELNWNKNILPWSKTKDDKGEKNNIAIKKKNNIQLTLLEVESIKIA